MKTMSATASWVQTEGQGFSVEGHGHGWWYKVVGSGGLLLLVCEAFGKQQKESNTCCRCKHTKTGASQACGVHQVVWLENVLAVRSRRVQPIVPRDSFIRFAEMISPCFLANDYFGVSSQFCHQLLTKTVACPHYSEEEDMLKMKNEKKSNNKVAQPALF